MLYPLYWLFLEGFYLNFEIGLPASSLVWFYIICDSFIEPPKNAREKPICCSSSLAYDLNIGVSAPPLFLLDPAYLFEPLSRFSVFLKSFIYSCIAGMTWCVGDLSLLWTSSCLIGVKSWYWRLSERVELSHAIWMMDCSSTNGSLIDFLAVYPLWVRLCCGDSECFLLKLSLGLFLCLDSTIGSSLISTTDSL